jgi:hypothetical protein
MGLSVLQVHGLCMALAWVVVVPIGIITARFGRKYTSHWFNLHRAIQVGTLVFLRTHRSNDSAVT